VFSAVNQMGQGIATTLAQLVVDVFGVPIDRVRSCWATPTGATALAAPAHARCSPAARPCSVGSERTIDHAKPWRPRRWRPRPPTSPTAGRFTVKGTDVGIDLFALAAKQDGGRIHMDSTSTVSGPTWPNGCHVSEVEIDPATGEVQWWPTAASTTWAAWSTP
jgi:carbon-monoxide dehydrogenase large subunit